MPNGVAEKGASMNETSVPVLPDKPFFLSIDRASLLPAKEVVERLESDASRGLTAEEVASRLARFGPNELGKKAQVNPVRLFINQFISTVVGLLIVAAIVSECAGEHLQAAGIAIAVLINGIVGFITEYKAQVSLAALEKLSGPVSRVRRGGQDFEVPASEIVPGDVLILEEGARVPADVRLLSAASLSLDESMLSGESIPVYKSSELGDETEQVTVAYQGTLILKGRAKALVVATGSNTKLGQLGHSLTEIRAKATPLQDDLEKLGKQLSLFTVVVCAALFGLGLLHGEKPWEMVQVSIALAVAAIPEGLPVVATLALATGTNRMVKLGALIRKLSAVETLGCTEVICTDKTGTLTQNQMTVTDIVLDGRHLNVSGLGYTPEGEFSENNCVVLKEERSFLKPLLTAAVLCNDAKLEMHEDAQWHIHGDPTEGALLTVGLKAGIEQKSSREELPRQKEFPFELSRKRMTTIHQSQGGDFLAYTKGAPETVLALCMNYLSSNGVSELDQPRREWFLSKNIELASKGLRVLGLAARDLGTRKVAAHADAESDMTFLGLIGMSDRPKEGVLEAIEECKRAGIKVIMLTGDQPATAVSIASDLNILPSAPRDADALPLSFTSNNDVVIGRDLEKMDAEQVKERLSHCSVLARVQPEAKLSIVQALQSAGKVVAMTGDGINDAPALQQSDIGVAMGRSGTSLAREASDMVITDDNFPTIVHAVEQGRVIYSNISCAVAYLLTASLASVLTVAAAVVFDTGLPLSPLQLLWLNLIMHIFPGLGLVLQKARPGIMREAPRGRKQSLLGRKEYIQIFMRGAVVSLVTILAAESVRGQSLEYVRSVVLATISVALLLQSWSWLAARRPADDWSYLSSGAMYLNTVMGIGLLLVATLFPPMQAILETVNLTAQAWSATILFALFSFLLTSLMQDY
ncbi:MAG TPA: cation-transporting P-type ATPase [Candidatus Melainabacteria bacterium]|nr:cation-transporting P-type ATPase [Candidatus Melainabacteria bacterium]